MNRNPSLTKPFPGYFDSYLQLLTFYVKNHTDFNCSRLFRTILFEKSHSLNRLHSNPARSELGKEVNLNMENQVCV